MTGLADLRVVLCHVELMGLLACLRPKDTAKPKVCIAGTTLQTEAPHYGGGDLREGAGLGMEGAGPGFPQVEGNGHAVTRLMEVVICWN